MLLGTPIINCIFVIIFLIFGCTLCVLPFIPIWFLIQKIFDYRRKRREEYIQRHLKLEKEKSNGN